MNKVYKVIWSSIKGCYIVVSEMAHRGRNKTKRLKAVCALTALLFASSMSVGLLEVQAAEDGPKTSFGYKAAVTGDAGTAVGYEAKVTGTSGTAIGQEAGVTGASGTAVGISAKVEGESGTAVGYKAVVIGMSGIAVGREVEVTGESGIAVGKWTKVTGTSGIAIGRQAKVYVDSGTAIGADSSVAADSGKSVAIGSGSKVLADDLFTDDELAARKQAHTEYTKFDVQKADSSNGVFSVGASGIQGFNRRIINVANGRISADSTDAVNGSQLYGAVEYLDGRIDSIGTSGGSNADTAGIKRTSDDKSGYITTIEGGVSFSSGGAMSNVSSINGVGFGIKDTTIILNGTEYNLADFNKRIGNLENSSSGGAGGSTGGGSVTTITTDGNITVTDKGQNGNHDYQLGLNQNGIKIGDVEIDGTNGGKVTAGEGSFTNITAGKGEIGGVKLENGKITAANGGDIGGVKLDKNTVTAETGNFDTVNVKNDIVIGEGDDAVSLKEVGGRVDGIEQQIAGLDSSINKVDDKVNKVGAGAAALAALHPLEFDPDDKLTFSAGVGHYEGETAAALGAFYRPDEKVMFSLGGTVGNGEDMINAGISFALDRTSKAPTSKEAMAQKIVELETDKEAMAQEIVELKAQVAQLTAVVNQIAAREGKK